MGRGWDSRKEGKELLVRGKRDSEIRCSKRGVGGGGR